MDLLNEIEEERLCSLISRLHLDNSRLCHKKYCDYCSSVRICKHCNTRLFCTKVSSCWACGRQSRRLDHKTGIGFVILTIKNGQICLALIKEKWDRMGRIGDLGGRFDPDYDDDFYDTLVREVHEEAGLVYQGTRSQFKKLPFIELPDNTGLPTYRMILIKHQVYPIDKPNFVLDQTANPESDLVYIPLVNALNQKKKWFDLDGNSHPVRGRLIGGLQRKLMNALDQTKTLINQLRFENEMFNKTQNMSVDLKKLLRITQ